ncbi:MAG: response regulator [bacterium]|nr:response regulator [bacterium]
MFTASTGLEAMRVLEQDSDRLDGALLDLSMPKMDGGELISHVRRCYADRRVVVMTGHGPGFARDRLADSPSTPVLLKPFSIDELRSCLGSVMDIGYSDDPRAREALELAASEDTSESVRQEARRAMAE